MSLQDAKILSFVLAKASIEEAIPMVRALLANNVKYTKKDYELICRRRSLRLFKVVLETENINDVISVGGFTGTSLRELKFFEQKGASIELLNKIFPYNLLHYNEVRFFVARGFKQEEALENALANSYSFDELPDLVNLGAVPSQHLLKRYYNTYLLTCFPPHDNQVLQLRAIAKDDLDVVSLLNIDNDRYSFDNISETDFRLFDTHSLVIYKEKFTALDCALLAKSYNVARWLISRNAELTIEADEIALEDNICELLFYNYPNSKINLSFNINQARKLWNDHRREKIKTLVQLQLDNSSLSQTPNEILFIIAYFM